MKAYKRIFLTICFFGITSLAFAQPPGGPPEDEETIPLDGGISLLAGAGILYGIRAVYKDKKS